MSDAIVLNGHAHALIGVSSLAELLEQLGYGEKRVAVERNGAIVPRSKHSETVLVAGDRIEIVQAIGGG